MEIMWNFLAIWHENLILIVLNETKTIYYFQNISEKTQLFFHLRNQNKAKRLNEVGPQTDY